MKVSFDGLRKNIAEDFNSLISEFRYQNNRLPENSYINIRDEIANLRKSLGCLMACYDTRDMPEDFNDLSEEIELLEL
jgi:hypothetical protein